MTLGQKIKKLRTDKGLTQRELSDRLHVTFQTVSKWEKDENEPDVSTLREFAKLFGCSLDYLLSEADEEKEVEEPVAAPVVEEPKTVVIHQRELHVCEQCKKDIPEWDFAMEQICVRHAGRGHAAEYRPAYYHRACYEAHKKQRAEDAKRLKAMHTRRAKKFSFGWGIAGGVVALIIALLCLLFVPECKTALHPAIAVLLSFVISYGIFSMIYCIISGSYIGEVFLWCAGLSIKFPGLIFSWNIEGFIWVITMKLLFAVLGFLFGILALIFAIVFSASLGMISFPFVLVHNNRTGYEGAILN